MPYVNHDPNHMTVNEVVSILHVSPKLVRDYAKAGNVLKGSQDGTRWLITKESVAEAERILTTYLTPSQAAATYGLSVSTVQKAYKAGKLDGILIFGGLRFHPDVISNLAKHTGLGTYDKIAKIYVIESVRNGTQVVRSITSEDGRLGKTREGIRLMSPDGDVLFPWGVVTRVFYKPSR